MTNKNFFTFNEYQPSKDDVILLDTNIMIDLFFPVYGNQKNNVSSLYSKIVASKAKLLITSVQISELINRYIRIQFGLYVNEHPECIDFKKQYRSTSDFQENMNIALDVIKNEIMPIFSPIDDGFSQIESSKIYLYNFGYDFNDALILQIAEKNSAIFITNDGDFLGYDIKCKLVSDNSLLKSMNKKR